MVEVVSSGLRLVVAVFGVRIEWRQATFPLFFAVIFPSVLEAGQTNEQAVQISIEDPVTLQNANALDVLVDRFAREVTTDDRIVFDRFTGPPAQLAWMRTEIRFGAAAYESINGRGAGLFGTIGLDSLRIAAVDALPVESWQDGWGRWAGHLIASAIGNPEEQHSALVSGSYSAIRSSWESASTETGIQWGIRPWNTYPYVYILAHAGVFEGQPLLTFEAKAGYRFLDAPRIEGRLTTQLPSSFRLAAGVGFGPSRMSEHQPGAAAYAATIERVLRPHSPRSDAVFFVGFRSCVDTTLPTPRRENMVLAGVSTGW